MRIIYITGCLPYGPAEAFLVDEIREMLRGNQVLVVPRSPGKLGRHGACLAPYTRRENLFSLQVLKHALGVLLSKPRRVVAAAQVLLRSRSVGVALRNVAVLPKALWLAALATQWKADHIHCHWAGTTATMAMIASELSGVPWSLTAHRSDIVSNNLLAEKARSATLVRTISEDGRTMMIARGVKPDAKLQVLPMGVRIPNVIRLNRPEPAVVLCPADLLEVKGHRFLFQAWKLLIERGITAQLWLAGEGELRASLEAAVRELRIRDSVTFLGTIQHDDLLSLYKAGSISLVALASVDLGRGCHEGLPVALVEAMSYGIPVIATATGGIPELVQPGTGLLVPAEDPWGLAGAIQRVLEDQTLAQCLGRNGHRRVKETRDIKLIVSELESSFRGSVVRCCSQDTAATPLSAKPFYTS